VVFLIAWGWYRSKNSAGEEIRKMSQEEEEEEKGRKRRT
jgi:hypothetical protein